MTLTDILNNKSLRFNKSTLAEHLRISRNTISLYLPDKEGSHHFICETTEGKYNFFTNKTRKITDESN